MKGNHVIFAIDDGQNPMRRNQFMQVLMGRDIRFRQLIGSYVMDSGETVVEWSYSVTVMDFDRLENDWIMQQESLIVLDDINRAHLHYLTDGKDNGNSLYLGHWKHVSRRAARRMSNWTLDIPTQTYWATGD